MPCRVVVSSNSARNVSISSGLADAHLDALLLRQADAVARVRVEACEDFVAGSRDVDERGAQRHDALFGHTEPVPLEKRDGLRRPRPLRLEPQQECAPAAAASSMAAPTRRRPPRRRRDPPPGRAARSRSGVRPGLEHQHLQRARRSPRIAAMRVGGALRSACSSPIPRSGRSGRGRGFDEGVPGLAIAPGTRVSVSLIGAAPAHAVAATVSFFETPRVSSQKSP